MDYKGAGVNIVAGENFARRIAHLAMRTQRAEIIGGIGGFASLCAIPSHYREPLLVTCTDGVGSKLQLAIEMQALDEVGIDLVAMCANDLIVTGGEPLLFLDYYATGALDLDAGERLMRGIVRGCELAGCSLAGGETAELPGLYAPGQCELAGFALGIVEKKRLIDGHAVQIGDAVIALASSGLHANGYSLVRKIIGAETEHHKHSMLTRYQLLTPTRIYVKAMRAVIQQIEVTAIAHITGGGLHHNLQRVLPHGLQAHIVPHPWPEVFHWLKSAGDVTSEEMMRVFNCGIGMVCCVRAQDINRTVDILTECGERAWRIGTIEQTPNDR